MIEEPVAPGLWQPFCAPNGQWHMVRHTKRSVGFGREFFKGPAGLPMAFPSEEAAAELAQAMNKDGP
jgi:hypothetical protein